MNVADWLRALGLEQYEAAFCENDVDVEVLPTLTADELKDIGVSSIRHRRRLLEAIAVLRSKSMGPEAPALAPLFPPSDTRGQPGASETTPERRPLSVMFCDLVGSTALSSQLDPEDLREIIRNYQGCVATTIQHFDGFIARYVGDGVLIYFGRKRVKPTPNAPCMLVSPLHLRSARHGRVANRYRSALASQRDWWLSASRLARATRASKRRWAKRRTSRRACRASPDPVRW
jgi:class 3 adenylate cyclase